MSEADGKAIGEALLAHEDHELYDAAFPGEIAGLERMLRIQVPPSLRGLLLVGSGGILANGDLLLGTKDPDELGATLLEVARSLWEEGLPRSLLPFLDGERFFCLDLEEEDRVVEVDPEDFRIVERLGPLPEFLRKRLDL